MTKKFSNAAQVRGDIQRGLTGDKRHGFDPAIAPMETDAEAAGTPMTQEQTELARSGQIQGKPDKTASEYSNAMRPPDADFRAPARHSMMSVIIAGCVVMIVVIGYLMTS